MAAGKSSAAPRKSASMMDVDAGPMTQPINDTLTGTERDMPWGFRCHLAEETKEFIGWRKRRIYALMNDLWMSLPYLRMMLCLAAWKSSRSLALPDRSTR